MSLHLQSQTLLLCKYTELRAYMSGELGRRLNGRTACEACGALFSRQQAETSCTPGVKKKTKEEQKVKEKD